MRRVVIGAVLAIVGFGIAGALAVDVPINVRPAIVFTPATAAFSGQSIGSPSDPLTITIQNNGTVSVPVTSIAFSGINASDFSLNSNSCGGSVAAGSSCQVDVVFTPSGGAAEVAALSLTATGGHVYTAAMSGNITLSIVLSPATAALFDHDTLGKILSTASASWSDASPFAGTYSITADPAGLCQLSGATVLLERTLSPADDGTKSCTVQAAQGVTASADLAIVISAPPVSAVAIPPGAQAAGFTTLAFDGDFSKGLDLGCWPGQDSAAHTWYQGIWYAGGFTVPCSRISLISDPVAGKQVVGLTWQSTDSATYGATVLETINQAHNRVTDFPSGYYEAVFRVDTVPNVIGIGSTWWNTWMWGTTQAQTGMPGAEMIEYDIMEQHGQSPTFVISGCINWGAGGPGNGCGYTYNQFLGGFDYRQYHKFGYRITNNGSSIVVCGYLDGALKGCHDADAFGDELIQRNFLIASVGWGCDFQNGFGNCYNRPLSNVYSCPSPYAGQICFTVTTSDCCGTTLLNETNDQLAYISEIQGVPNANGVWQVTALDPYPGPRSIWVLEGSTFSGSWVPGTGYFNKYDKITMYLQTFRVWSCASWATTMCNGPVLSGAP